MGRPGTYVTPTGVTEQAVIFIRSLIASGDVALASERCGFSDSRGHALLRDPRMIQAVRAEMTKMLAVDGAPTAFRALTRIAKDDNAPAGARVMAAKALLSAAGYGEGQVKPQGEAKALNEMTPDELRDLIARHEKEIDAIESTLASKATPVSAPVEGALPPGPIDILD
jgi:hypothetical protein